LPQHQIPTVQQHLQTLIPDEKAGVPAPQSNQAITPSVAQTPAITPPASAPSAARGMVV